MKICIICLLLLMPLMSEASEKIKVNEWTNEMVTQFIDSCVTSAVNSNMQHIIDKNDIKSDSEDYTKILKNITEHQTAVCSCTQKYVMKDYRFSDTEKMMSNKSYIITVAKKCSKQVLDKSKK